MAQFMLSVHHEPGTQSAGTAYSSEEEAQAAFDAVSAFNQQLEKDGQLVFVGALYPPESASTVSVDGHVTNGPAHDLVGRQLGGFWIVDVRDRQSAVVLAEKAAQACRQPIEVRQFEG